MEGRAQTTSDGDTGHAEDDDDDDGGGGGDDKSDVP